MAKLPEDINDIIWNLKRQTLDIIESSTATEFTLFDLLGETEATLSYLEEMKNVAESATSFYSRLSNLHLQITQAQPQAPRDLLRLLYQTIEITSIRLPALERSRSCRVRSSRQLWVTTLTDIWERTTHPIILRWVTLSSTQPAINIEYRVKIMQFRDIIHDQYKYSY